MDLEQLKQRMEAIFGTEEVKSTKEGYKVNLAEIHTGMLVEMDPLIMNYDVRIKRSGTGLVINCKLEEEE